MGYFICTTVVNIVLIVTTSFSEGRTGEKLPNEMYMIWQEYANNPDADYGFNYAKYQSKYFPDSVTFSDIKVEKPVAVYVMSTNDLLAIEDKKSLTKNRSKPAFWRIPFYYNKTYPYSIDFVQRENGMYTIAFVQNAFMGQSLDPVWHQVKEKYSDRELPEIIQISGMVLLEFDNKNHKNIYAHYPYKKIPSEFKGFVNKPLDSLISLEKIIPKLKKRVFESKMQMNKGKGGE